MGELPTGEEAVERRNAARSGRKGRPHIPWGGDARIADGTWRSRSHCVAICGGRQRWDLTQEHSGVCGGAGIYSSTLDRELFGLGCTYLPVREDEALAKPRLNLPQRSQV